MSIIDAPLVHNNNVLPNFASVSPPTVCCFDNKETPNEKLCPLSNSK